MSRLLPHLPGGLRGLVRTARRRGRPGLRVALWCGWSWHRVRRQLARTGLDRVRLAAPPPGTADDHGILLAVLRRVDATCLERSLVRQRWYAAQRVSRTLVIGVIAPSAGFRAHAWLDGDPEAPQPGMVEIMRRPPPPDWLAGPPDETSWIDGPPPTGPAGPGIRAR